MNKLQEQYQKEIVPSLIKELNLDNVMQCPAITKVVVNIGVGDALDNGKLLDEAVRDLTKITGQKPLINKSKRNAHANIKNPKPWCSFVSESSAYICTIYIFAIWKSIEIIVGPILTLTFTFNS